MLERLQKKHEDALAKLDVYKGLDTSIRNMNFSSLAQIEETCMKTLANISKMKAEVKKPSFVINS